jgi:hypothetical protein
VGGKSPAAGPSAAEKTGRTFQVHEAHEKNVAETQKVDATHAAERSPLERLRAGEIDVNGYVDLKVDAATRGLSGLSRVELEQIRGMLKHQMGNDPAVMDLVKQATGSLPSAKPEGE